MAINKIIAGAENLPKQGEPIAAELSGALSITTNDSLDQLLPISDATLAVKWHSLDMKVEGRSIYNHLAIFKEHLLNIHANNDKLIKALPTLAEGIKKFKLYTPAVDPQEQNKNIKDRTIITGDQQGNQGGSTKTGVPDITYLRNESFTQNVPVESIIGIIEEIEGYGLSEADAVRLLVVIAGLPKAGYQDPDGKWYGVGDCGCFAIQRLRVGKRCFLFADNNAFLGKVSANTAMPPLRN